MPLWVDQHDIRPSEHWDRAVEAALRASAGVVLILSPASAASSNVGDEISVAVDLKKHMLPVMIAPCTPPLRITRVQYIDATHDRAAALQRCLAAIRAAGTVPSAPDPRPIAARSPAVPPEVLAEATRRLTPLLGPIAPELVRRAAAKAATEAEFYADLEDRVPFRDRARFMAGIARGGSAPTSQEQPAAAPEAASPTDAAEITPEALEAITRALTDRLGPIAAALVKRERGAANGKADLIERLSRRIPAPKDRAAFVDAALRAAASESL